LRFRDTLHHQEDIFLTKLRFAVLIALTPALLAAQKSGSEHWVATWATAQLLARTQPPRPGAPAPHGFNNQTIRMIARASIGGTRVRVKLENSFDSDPVEVGAAHIALRSKDSGIVEGSDRPLTFNGKPSITLGPGMLILSDPVDLNVAPLSDLAVSLYFPGETGPPTIHSTALHDTYISKQGDTTAQPAMMESEVTHSYYWLAAVDVEAPPSADAIVAFGDSITDGARSENETNHSWPALLAARLAASKQTAHVAVVNLGIGGNRVVRDNSGVSALARFDRDVLSQSGAKWVMILEAINDIGHGSVDPTQPVTADQLIGAYKQIIERAHTHGIKVIGCTLTPYEGAGYYREEGEAIREAVNQWIRTGGGFDGVVDFEAAVRDPANPKHIRPEFDPGDHLHPNNAGYQAMADRVDLSLFGGKKTSSTH
jgi:lysophospholipase L1-like esterase